MSQSDSIIMPLGLSELVVVKQETEADDGFTLSVRYQRTSSPCPRCHRSSTKLHDERAQECRAVACAVGRDGKELRRWCERLPDPWTIEAVAMDMSATFRSVVELC